MVWIPPGTFWMGAEDGQSDEKPVHQITVTKGFLIGKYEVTAGEWKAVMGKEPPGFKADHLPAQPR